MTSEQIKIVSDLQNRIDKLNRAIEIVKRTYIKGSDIKYNEVMLKLYVNNDIVLKNLISDDKHISIIQMIIDTIAAELELLTIERNNYILSKPV